MNVKAIIASLVLGSSAVVVAAPNVTRSASMPSTYGTAVVRDDPTTIESPPRVRSVGWRLTRPPVTQASGRSFANNGRRLFAAGSQAGKSGAAHAALQLTGAAHAHASNVVTTLTNEITLEAWVRWDDQTSAQAVLYNGNSATSGYGIYLRNGGVSILSGGVDWADCTTCHVVPGVWTHLAAVRSNNQWVIYQDAIAQAVSNANLPSAPPSGVLSIASSPAGGERLIGAIDEVRVWTIARTAQQIAADYTVSLTGMEPDLIAYYRFDEGRGSVANDSAGNHPITIYNAPRWTTSGARLTTVAR